MPATTASISFVELVEVGVDARRVVDRQSGTQVAEIPDPSRPSYGNASPYVLLGGYGNAVACADDRITSFDIARRAVAWTQPGCHGSAFAAANGLVFRRTASHLVASEEIDGSEAWRVAVPGAAGNILATREHVIVSDSSRTYFIDQSTRNAVMTLQAAGEKVLTPDGRLFVSGSQNLQVFALEVIDTSGTIFTDSFD